MKRITFVLLALLTGCIVRSFHPFCTEKSATFPKELMGEWKVQKYLNDDVTGEDIKPWTFTGDSATNGVLEAHDKKNNLAKFATVFFKAGDRLFLCARPDEATVNELWFWCMQPAFVVCRVEAKDDTLTLKPLSYKWLREALEKQEVTLPYVGELKDGALFTATAEQWEVLLEKHGNSPEAFPEEQMFVLKRAKPPARK